MNFISFVPFRVNLVFIHGNQHISRELMWQGKRWYVQSLWKKLWCSLT